MVEQVEKYLLTHEEAKVRSGAIEDVSYELRLGLSKGDEYSGFVKVSFTYKDPSAELWVDFKGKLVQTVTVNGTSIEVRYKDNKIWFSSLIEGRNEVSIEYENKYSHDGYGLHCFKDPEDEEIYLYTQHEPFACNRLFPCFDQPDLKATLELTIAAPSTWKVISNTNASQKINIPQIPGTTEKQTLHIFPKTPKISTYLYALCAGSYVEHRCDENPTGIKLGLFCRKSLNKYLVPERYFNWTIKGLQFYNEFFAFPYPFFKYDQVFVPEFNMGAMENVGCVTYRDQYIFKDPPSNIQLTRVCDTFLHEMAHMWFGDLVTMKWWEDLWLNESFASIMSVFAMEGKLYEEYPTIWLDFLGGKGWGYATDQLSTTHPICTPVNDTDECETNFDGISYAKGSAVLKQLYFLVGREAFMKSLQNYMQKYQYSNAEFNNLIDLIAEQARAAGNPIDIHQWADRWVRTAGLNELAAVIEKDDQGVITKFTVKQTPALAEHPTLRDHKIIIEVFDENLNQVKQAEVLILPQPETVLEEFHGLKASCAILNVGDWGYCKVRIDEGSFSILKNHLNKIPEPLTRQLVYRALWDMVRDIKTSAVEFIEFTIQNIPKENNFGIANYAMEIAGAAFHSYIPNGQAKEDLAHGLLEVILDKIRNAASPQDAIVFQKKAIHAIYHRNDIDKAVEWVRNDSTGIEGWKLGQLDRWNIIKKYAEITPEASSLVEAELKRDQSDTGHLSKIYCEAAYPIEQNKREKWENYLTEGEKMSRYEREESMSGFNREKQADILSWCCDEYFAKVGEVISTKDKEYSKDFCFYLVPGYVEDGVVIEKLEKLLPTLPQDRFDISRGLRETIDDLKRFKRGKELSAAYLAGK